MDIGIDRIVTILIRVEFPIGLMLMVYSLYFKLESLENYFEGNEVVQRNKRVWSGKRPQDKSLRMGQISCFLMFPKSYIRSGDVSEEELASIPLPLKRWATWPYYFGIQMFMWVGVDYVLRGS